MCEHTCTLAVPQLPHCLHAQRAGLHIHLHLARCRDSITKHACTTIATTRVRAHTRAPQGSTFTRTSGPHADQHDPKTIFKDLDLDMTIRLPTELHDRCVRVPGGLPRVPLTRRAPGSAWHVALHALLCLNATRPLGMTNVCVHAPPLLALAWHKH